MKATTAQMQTIADSRRAALNVNAKAADAKAALIEIPVVGECASRKAYRERKARNYRIAARKCREMAEAI